MPARAAVALQIEGRGGVQVQRQRRGQQQAGERPSAWVSVNTGRTGC
jgi:hypothetical protein